MRLATVRCLHPRVKASYNRHDMVFRHRCLARPPSIDHDRMKLDGGTRVHDGTLGGVGTE
jgi:hypothetical protein